MPAMPKPAITSGTSARPADVQAVRPVKDDEDAHPESEGEAMREEGAHGLARVVLGVHAGPVLGDVVLMAKELPARVADLGSGLADVKTQNLSHLSTWVGWWVRCRLRCCSGRRSQEFVIASR